MYLTNDTTLMDMSLNTDKQKIEKKGLVNVYTSTN